MGIRKIEDEIDLKEILVPEYIEKRKSEKKKKKNQKILPFVIRKIIKKTFSVGIVEMSLKKWMKMK